MKRYLGAALVAFVLGCVGPLTVGAAQAAEEPDGTSSLAPVIGTVGALTGSKPDTEPAPAPGEESGPADPWPPEPPPEPEPAPENPEPTEPGPAEPVPDDTDTAPGALRTVTTTVGNLATAPGQLLSGVAGTAQPPESPAEPDTPEAPEPPEPTDPPSDTPESPETPGDPPGEPDNTAPDTPPGNPDDIPAGSPTADTPASERPGVGHVALPGPDRTRPEHTGPALGARPGTVQPERTDPRGPKLGAALAHGGTASGDEAPAEQHKGTTETPNEVRADAVSLKHVTRTPFLLAIALLTAVGVVTVRRVITVN